MREVAFQGPFTVHEQASRTKHAQAAPKIRQGKSHMIT